MKPAELPRSVDRRFFTSGVLVLFGLAAVGLFAAVYRFIFGLAAATNLDQQHPWGLWIAVDVATGVALASGGFTTAAFAYVFHREAYHAISRPALLTAMLGYTFVGLGLMADLGRYYNIWHPAWPTMWQGKSVLFEVGMCVMAYLTVLYIEFVPIVCERFMDDPRRPQLARACRGLHRIIGRTMFAIILAGVVLSCLHQSSLGSLMLIAPSKMHPLWYSPILPLLFLLSAISVGLPMVIVESVYAAWALGLEPEGHSLRRLAKPAAILLGLYLAFKLCDLFIRDVYGRTLDGSGIGFLFLIEVIAGVVVPLVVFATTNERTSLRRLASAAVFVVLGVALNRINVYILAYEPPYSTTSYFPSAVEFAVTIGLFASLILCYRAIVMFLPVISHTSRIEPAVNRRSRESSPLIVAGSLIAMLVVGAMSSPLAAAPVTQPETLGENCAACHAGTPTAGHPSLRACTRGEMLRRTKELDGRRGPRVVVLDELENIYLPVPFDHSGHAEMAQMSGGCVICHHYTPEGQEQPACKSCHDPSARNSDIAKPGLKGAYHRQCMSCHREWSGESGCSACHQPKTGRPAGQGKVVPTSDDLIGRMHPPIPEPETETYTTRHPDGEVSRVLFRHREHIHGYNLRCAECHREDGCNRCHKPGKEHVQQVRTFEQHHQPCQQCHRRDTCEKCHFPESSSAPAPFDHSTTGWALKSYHAGQGCRACHPTVPFERRDRSCNACHSAWNVESFRHAVTGQLLDETHARVDCAECHKDRDYSRIPACDGCHDADDHVSFPAKRPGPVIQRAGN